jgi:DNA-binding HxlR family transcriptional regulator
VSIRKLIELFHHRWAAPILAELERQRGARLVVLVNRLRAPRDTVRRTLDALIDAGLVERNPGYGHPLRPEYVLTDSGRPVARRCVRLLEEIGGRADVGLKKWSMPVLVALGRATRFSELRAALPGVTPRALAIALKDLQALGLATREVLAAYPPSTAYRLTDEGRRVRRILV